MTPFMASAMYPYVVMIVFVPLWLLFGINITAQETPADVNRFGIVEGFWFPEVTCDLGVGWERIIFDWSQHQPNGPDDWHTLNVDDRWLKAADACNREVVALLKNTPAWATNGDPGVGVPRGLDLPLDDPGNVWANFVRRAVDYYASRGVYRFIIWNEPDISRETYGYEFSGDLDDYYQLLRVAYLAAHEANPAVRIHLAGTTYWHDVNEGRRPYFERLIERIAADPDAAEHGYYFDVMSLHIYFRSQSVYDLVSTVRTLLDENGLQDKAIWINETNAAPTIDPAWPVQRPQFPLDLTQQASFIMQGSALALAAGVERMAVYKLYDQQLPSGNESFGILGPADAEPRPAYYAWRTAIEYLQDVTSAQLVQHDAVSIVALEHGNGRQTLVAWARTEQPVSIEIPVNGGKLYQVNHFGTQQLVQPSDDVQQISLPGATCDTEGENPEGCFIGGVPVLLLTSQPVSDVRLTSTDAVLSFD